MLNLAESLSQKQGLPDFEIVAVVVDNNDPKQLGRIRARVPHMFDGIADDELPWAIMKTNSSSTSDGREGSFSVPLVGAKVAISFQEGSVLHPVYSGYFVDQTTQLQEIKYNYPNRLMFAKLTDLFMSLYDRVAKRFFFRVPGKTSIYIAGDVEIRYGGNVTEYITGNKTTIVEGNHTTQAQTRLDYTFGMEQSYSGGCLRNINGASNVSINGTYVTSVNGVYELTVAGVLYQTASIIQENLDGHSGPSVPSVVQPAQPEFEPWDGINGDYKGE